MHRIAVDFLRPDARPPRAAPLLRVALWLVALLLLSWEVFAIRALDARLERMAATPPGTAGVAAGKAAPGVPGGFARVAGIEAALAEARTVPDGGVALSTIDFDGRTQRFALAGETRSGEALARLQQALQARFPGAAVELRSLLRPDTSALQQFEIVVAARP